jgi:hypothetical protein
MADTPQRRDDSLDDIDSFMQQRTSKPGADSTDDIDDFMQSRSSSPQSKGAVVSELDKLTSGKSALPRPEQTHLTETHLPAPTDIDPADPNRIAKGLVDQQVAQRAAETAKVRKNADPGTTDPANFLRTQGPSMGQPQPNLDMQEAPIERPRPGTEYGPGMPTPEEVAAGSKFMLEEGPEKLARGAARLELAHGPTGTIAGPMNPETPEFVDTEEAAKASSEMMQGAAVTAIPFIPEAIAPAAPGLAAATPLLTTAAGFGAGYGASTLAEKALEHTDLAPESKQAIIDASWFIPSLLGLKAGFGRGPEGKPIAGISALGEEAPGVPRAGIFAGKTEDGGIGIVGKAGERGAGVKIGGAKKPSTTVSGVERVEQPALPGGAATAAEAHGKTEAGDAIAGTAQATGQPGRIVPPTPEQERLAALPPPTLEPIVGVLRSTLAAVPDAVRPFAIQEMHQNLVDWMLQHGTVTGPDGMIVTVASEAQASKVADRWINDVIQQHDEEAAKPQEKPRTGSREV